MGKPWSNIARGGRTATAPTHPRPTRRRVTFVDENTAGSAVAAGRHCWRDSIPVNTQIFSQAGWCLHCYANEGPLFTSLHMIM